MQMGPKMYSCQNGGQLYTLNRVVWGIRNDIFGIDISTLEYSHMYLEATLRTVQAHDMLSMPG